MSRPVEEIRADLACCDRDGVPWPAAARRLLADVPALLAEVEAAHRFERSAAGEREALLAEVERLERLVETMVTAANANARAVQAVEALVRTARFDPGPAGVRHPETGRPFVYTDDLRAALAAAADAPQLTPDDDEPLRKVRARQLADHGDDTIDPPAVLPEKEQRDV